MDHNNLAKVHLRSHVRSYLRGRPFIQFARARKAGSRSAIAANSYFLLVHLPRTVAFL